MLAEKLKAAGVETGIHHVNETVPRERWIFWDVALLIWGAAMLIGGWLWLRRGR